MQVKDIDDEAGLLMELSSRNPNKEEKIWVTHVKMAVGVIPYAFVADHELREAKVLPE